MVQYRMPKKAVIKKAKKHHGHKKRMGFNRKIDKVPEVALHMPLKKGCQMFPDRYFVTARTDYLNGFSLAGAPGALAIFQLDVFANTFIGTIGGNIGGSTGRGTYTYTQQVPAGLSYLLGDNNAGAGGLGGLAPYFNYRIHSSKIKVSWVPTLSAIATNSANTTLVIFPTIAPTTSYMNMSESQYCEQPYARVRDYPANITTTTKPMTNTMSTLRIWGDQYKATVESGVFDASYITNPSKTWRWSVSVFSTAASVQDFSIAGTIRVELEQDIEFFNRNNYTSTTSI